jgi:hypothetical protein
MPVPEPADRAAQLLREIPSRDACVRKLIEEGHDPAAAAAAVESAVGKRTADADRRTAAREDDELAKTLDRVDPRTCQAAGELGLGEPLAFFPAGTLPANRGIYFGLFALTGLVGLATESPAVMLIVAMVGLAVLTFVHHLRATSAFVCEDGLAHVNGGKAVVAFRWVDVNRLNQQTVEYIAKEDGQVMGMDRNLKVEVLVLSPRSRTFFSYDAGQFEDGMQLLSQIKRRAQRTRAGR